MRPRNHVHYKRRKRKGNGELHFCSWKCIREFDQAYEQTQEAKRMKPEQRIARRKEQIAKDEALLASGVLEGQERKRVQNRIHQRRRDVRLLEEELYGYMEVRGDAGCEC